MADIQREARAHWSGDLMKGSGTTSSGSGVMHDLPYSVPSRFQTANGTNPEEMLAAAHASCFSMMLAKILGDMKKTPQDIRTNATLTMAQRDGGWKITKIHLVTEATGEGVDDSVLNQAAQQEKDQCPVSVLLKPGLEELTLEVRKASR
jgi:osmotically inducible protein OsmC